LDDKYLEILENLCALNGKLEAIVESSTNGIGEMDMTGRILACNPSFQKIFQSPQLPDGTDFFQLFPPQEGFTGELLLKLHKYQNVFIKDIIIEEEDIQKRKFLEIKLVPLNISPGVDFIIIVKDKSDILTALHNREIFITTLLDIIDDIKVDNRKTIYNLAALVELRDTATGKHLERVEAYTRLLATEYYHSYGKRDKWVTEAYVEDMAVSAVLHDIGKVGISDTILLKPDKLSEMEMDAMKQHTFIAGKALEKHRGKKDFLSMGREIALTHHEKWNGKGYPRQLAGKEIPLCGRIVALCDTYDAITNDRPYKKAFSHDTACKIIRSERGEAFDPEIVDIFLKMEKEFDRINREMH